MMCLANKEAEEGDIICVTLAVPYRWFCARLGTILIGEAYVGGYMYGEATEMLEGGELDVQEFKLY
jgi:hypothetical protein